MEKKLELMDKSNQFCNSVDVCVCYHRPPHSVAIRNSSSLNKVCYCSSDNKHQASAVTRVDAGGSEFGKCDVNYSSSNSRVDAWHIYSKVSF